MSNALIFAAGLGTRLRPLTDTMPKAMVPVGGRPLLQILIERLVAAGITDIVVNVHHFAQQVIDFLDDSPFSRSLSGVRIQVSDESDMLLETGGGLKRAARLFADKSPILVHNVDILSDLDLRSFYSSVVQRQGSPTTLIVSQRNTQRYLLADSDSRLVGWTNIATGEVKSPYPDLDVQSCTKVAFSGIHVFNPALLPYMEKWEGKFSLIDFYLSICDCQPIYLQQQSDLHLIDVGKLDTLAVAEQFLQNQN